MGKSDQRSLNEFGTMMIFLNLKTKGKSKTEYKLMIMNTLLSMRPTGPVSIYTTQSIFDFYSSTN